MDSNETNRPLTEVPMDKTPETLVSVSYTHLTLPTNSLV